MFWLIALCYNRLAIVDLACTLTVVDKQRRRERLFLGLFPLQLSVESMAQRCSGDLAGLYKAILNRGAYVIDISFPKPRLDERCGQSSLLQVFHN